ncbi:MAG: stage II sporulation protein P, partial [Bacillus sp. (in: firmicutes)]
SYNLVYVFYYFIFFIYINHPLNLVKKEIDMRRILHFYFISIFITMFSSIFIVNYVDWNFKLSSNLVSNSIKMISADALSLSLSNEIALFSLSDTNKDVRKPSIVKGIVLMTSSIWPSDVRTYLGRELIGFSSFNTEIAIAGKGTDITTLPIESQPPIEVLFKENDAIEKEQKETQQSNKESNHSISPEKNSVVYIYHSHSWEAFLPQLPGHNINQAASLDEDKNVIQVGKQLQKELLERGIGAAHSTANVTEELKKKNWNYAHSYNYTREQIQEVTAKEKSIVYLIDIHRDSQTKKITTLNLNGKSFARLFFIVGKENKNYEHNLKLAKNLNEKLEQRLPGVSRGVFIKSKDEGNGVYNQDLSGNAMLLEFGGVENSQEELDNTIEVFSDVFSDYYKQVEKVDG